MMKNNNIFNINHYSSHKKAQRNQIFLHQNLFTLLGQGEKVVHYANSKTTIKPHQFALLCSGNCLMTEKLSINNSYQSTMLFFADVALTNFFIKYSSVIDEISSAPLKSEKPFIVFEKDEFIKNYISSLQFIHTKTSDLLDKMIELKFEELMLYLLNKYPREILSFQLRSQQENSDLTLKKAVEKNITSNLTVEELAFLCHMSVSTFKRRFLKLYSLSPNQYFLKRKMELAKSMLMQNKNPGEIFHEIGYESHSGFSQFFKKFYGISPKQFQRQNMIISQHSLTD